MCRSVIFSMCWYERTRARYNTLLVLCERARAAWLCSCHTVAHSTCPLIGVDLLDLLPIRLCYRLSTLWNFFSQPSSTKINQPQSPVFFVFNPKTAPTSLGIRHLEVSSLSNCACVSLCETFWCLTPLKSDFILWLWRCDVRFCAHLKLHREGSGEMHSFASLATDVGKSVFFPPLSWTLWSV